MRSRMIAIAAGFLIAAWQPQLIPITGYICIAVFTLLLTHFVRFRYRDLSNCVVFAFLYSSIWCGWQLSQKLPHEFVRSDWIVEGHVVGLPQHEGAVAKFNLKVNTLTSVSAAQSPDVDLSTIKLSWYHPKAIIQPNQALKLIVRLKPPHGMVNPEGFDYERWLLVRGIDATGYVRTFISADSRSSYSISLARHWLNENIESRHSEPNIVAILQALTTGYKVGFSQEDWGLLRKSGTVHLAVISGLHVGFMAVLGWWLGRIVGLIVFHRTHLMPYVFSIAFSTGYTLLAGAEIPTMRALIMITVLLLSGVQRRYIDNWTRWWMAIVAVLVFSPLAVTEVGFWLSFGAVALLIWLGQREWRWHTAIVLQLYLLIGMLPLYLFFFGGFSLVAPLVNLIAIPLISLLIIVAFINLFLNIVGAYLLIPLLTQVESWLVNVFWGLVGFCERFDWAFVTIDGVGLSSLVLVMIASLGIMLPAGWAPRYLILLLLLPMLLGEIKLSNQVNRFTATVFDVGQGQSVLVEVGDYRLLYDTGPSYRNGGAAFTRAVLPYLTSQAIRELNYLVLSHDDNDHVGGFSLLMDSLSVTKIASSYVLADLSYASDDSVGIESHDADRVDRGEIGKELCVKGLSWQVEGVTFSFISGSKGANDNDRSCVLMVDDGVCSLLIPGDISKRVEHVIINDFEGDLDWLVAAHHGSRSSSSETFLKHASPDVVVFSAGYGNAFNHPHPDVMSVVLENAAKAYTTAEDGAVLLKSSTEKGCITETMRKEVKRFWR